MIKDYLLKLIKGFPTHSSDKREPKPWQIGKPWCTKTPQITRMLWDNGVRGESYCYAKHGPL